MGGYNDVVSMLQRDSQVDRAVAVLVEEKRHTIVAMKAALLGLKKSVINPKRKHKAQRSTRPKGVKVKRPGLVSTGCWVPPGVWVPHRGATSPSIPATAAAALHLAASPTPLLAPPSPPDPLVASPAPIAMMVVGIRKTRREKYQTHLLRVKQISDYQERETAAVIRPYRSPEAKAVHWEL